MIGSERSVSARFYLASKSKVLRNGFKKDIISSYFCVYYDCICDILLYEKYENGIASEERNLFSYISSLISDPKATIMFFLLAFPGRILAISAHEFAHAWVADRCGDSTARRLGRLTMNPFKHLDIVGTLMMAFIGFGWAKPVPVDPRNYRNGRKDDLKVSLAGIVINLLFFLLSFAVLSVFLCASLRKIGVPLGNANYLYLLRNAPYVSDEIIALAYGRLSGYLYQMLAYFVQVNIVLAIFNLLPVPPLDGYHVVNDLLIHKPLFASEVTARRAMGVLFLLMITGVLGEGLGYAVDLAFSGMGRLMHALLTSIGMI